MKAEEPALVAVQTRNTLQNCIVAAEILQPEWDSEKEEDGRSDSTGRHPAWEWAERMR